MPSLESTRPSSFAADVLKSVTDTILVQVITILGKPPVITRLYGPEAFGFLALFTSITSILGVIARIRYELAVMLPKTDKEASGLCLLCVVTSALMVPAFGGDVPLALLGTPGSYLALLFGFVGGVFSR